MTSVLIGTSEQEYSPGRPVISQQLVHIDLRDERVQDVLERIRVVIKGTYKDAEFVSYVGTNHLGVYVEVYTSGNDFDGVLQVLSEKLGDLNIAAGVNVCVVPLQKRVVMVARGYKVRKLQGYKVELCNFLTL
jgi:hypothetical protein